MNKIAWLKNAKFKMDGTKLHIEVELDPKKIQPSPTARLLSSVLRRYKESPAGRIEVNISVRPLKPDE